ncbi:MAG TPA: hypothetical protein VLA56_10140 [Pseudomonadales bacterium]|nr:hypothetical protein [Pseudomonadales bacterium]
MNAGVVAIGRVRSFMLMCTILFGPMAWAETVTYGEATDAELQQLGGRWEALSEDERRALLTEVHRRMAAAGRKPVLRIRAERRYGYRVKQPDGSVVQIQRREGFVRYREIDPDQPFGVGFEQRSGLIPVQPASTDATAQARQQEAADKGPVPRASRVPVYQLPFREVQATEPRR